MKLTGKMIRAVPSDKLPANIRFHNFTPQNPTRLLSDFMVVKSMYFSDLILNRHQ